MKKYIISFLLVFVLAAPSFAASEEDKAVKFVQDGIGEMMEKVVKSKVSRAEKVKRFDKFFREYADLETVGKFALGRYWRSTSKSDQEKFIDVFSENVVVTWERRFEEYSGQQFEFMGTHPSSSGDDIFVDSQMFGGGQEPVKIVWRVRDFSGSMKLVDIVISNVSMLQTYRNEYAGVLAQSNGDVNVLIKRLQDNTEAARKSK